MATSTSSPTAEKDSQEKIREQLKKILASKAFQHVDRLQRFLCYIVDETIAGRADSLKEFPIGTDVFSKESSFDPRMDPIVRVQARRLRTRLTRYYREEGQSDEIVIEVPKGGYAPVFRHFEGAPSKRSLASALVSRNTVVVLPFTDHSPAGDQDSFCKGLGQEIIHTLARVGSISVVVSDRILEPHEAVNQHNVAMIISGSIRKSRDTLRITTHLIDAARGSYLWSDCIDRKAKNIFAVQEEVAKAILKKLQAEMSGSGRAKGARRPTENLLAHNLYLQGRYHLNQRTEQGLRKAVEFFEKAIQEDPQHAHAHSGLADAHGLLAHYGVLAPSEVWTKAASNAAWAVLLDDDSAEAHASLAHVKSTQDWDWGGAEREFKRAISLNPRYATAHHWYTSSFLVPLGRLDEGLEELLLAQALDPVSSIVARDIALIHYYKRDFDQALEQCDHTIEQNPHFSPAYWTLGLVQEQRGDFDESVAAFQRAIQLSPPSPRILGALGRTFAIAGKKDEALRILRELRSLAKKRYISPFELALIHFALDQVDRGFEWLAKAYEDRCFELMSIRVDPRFDSVVDDPRFTKLFKKLGLP